MKEKISMLLREYGLDNSEIKVYTYLVGKEKTTAYKIAKNTKIHKSTCYDVLNRLIIKGFVATLGEENKKYYLANEITEVLGRVKSKESILLSLMPEIQKLESKGETIVKHVDTPGSYLEIDTKIYELAKQGKITFGYIIGNNSELSTTSSRILVQKIIKDFSKMKSLKNIQYKGLWNKKFKYNKFMEQFNILGENKFLDSLSNKVTTFIFDEHIVFLFFSENESFIEIKNKQIAEEMKIYFEYLWKLAKK